MRKKPTGLRLRSDWPVAQAQTKPPAPQKVPPRTRAAGPGTGPEVPRAEHTRSPNAEQGDPGTPRGRTVTPEAALPGVASTVWAMEPQGGLWELIPDTELPNRGSNA